jgi:hypothetical protein
MTLNDATMVVLMLQGIGAARVDSLAPLPPIDCVSFTASRVVRDQAVLRPLPHDLEFRLVKFGVNGWRIEVGPKGEAALTPSRADS